MNPVYYYSEDEQEFAHEHGWFQFEDQLAAQQTPLPQLGIQANDNGAGNENPNPNENESENDNDNDGVLFPSIDRENSISCLVRCSRSDYDSVASLNKSFRFAIRSGDIYKLRRRYGVVEDWIYISCSLPEWEAFDPNRRRWRRLPPMHCNDVFLCADKESLGVGSDILVVGSEMFGRQAPMQRHRWLFGSTNVAGVAVYAGGCDATGRALPTAELYNSDTLTWTPLPDLNRAWKMCAGVFMDGKFYVIGGRGEAEDTLLSCGEGFDMGTGTWTVIPNMSSVPSAAEAQRATATEAPPLIGVVDNELYAADHVRMVVKKYDKGTREWITLGELPKSAAGCVKGWGMAFKGCGDMVIVISGLRTSSGIGIIEVNAWKPSQGLPLVWTLLSHRESSNFVYNCAIMSC